MRYLAIDPGDKRTGLAVGDDVLRIAMPLRVITAANETERLALIGKAIDEQGPDALVLGMPLNMDGSEGPGVTKSRTLAKMLTERYGLVVHLMDERLTSFDANEKMRGSDLTRGQKKARRDALAAAAILDDFLKQDARSPVAESQQQSTNGNNDSQELPDS